jgi:membrane protease YdiL (CAAX protease family)
VTIEHKQPEKTTSHLRGGTPTVYKSSFNTLAVAAVGLMGVFAIKHMDTLGWRHAALATWFALLTIVTELVTRSRKEVSGETLLGSNALVAPQIPPTSCNHSAGLRYFHWLGRPQSTFGAAAVAVYATASLFVYTTSSKEDQRELTFGLHLFAPDGLSQLILVAVIVPLYEEIYFRGALLFALSSNKAKLDFDIWRKLAFHPVYLSALLFWLAHLPASARVIGEHLAEGSLPLSPGTFLLGLVCGIVAWKDKSIWGAVFLHALANASGPLWYPLLSQSDIFQWFYAH